MQWTDFKIERCSHKLEKHNTALWWSSWFSEARICRGPVFLNMTCRWRLNLNIVAIKQRAGSVDLYVLCTVSGWDTWHAWEAISFKATRLSHVTQFCERAIKSFCRSLLNEVKRFYFFILPTEPGNCLKATFFTLALSIFIKVLIWQVKKIDACFVQTTKLLKN